MFGIYCFTISVTVVLATKSEVYKRYWVDTTASTIDLSTNLTNLNRCGHDCLSYNRWCEGFSFNERTDICDLYSTIIDTGSAANGYIWTRENPTQLVSRGKPASISTVATGAVASRGNDGVKPTVAPNEGDYRFETAGNGADPWWRVDLEATYTVKSVYFMNRGFSSCCWTRARNVMVTVALTEGALTADITNQCGYVPAAEQFDNWVYCPAALSGRYVQLQLQGVTDYFALYEVEVFA